MATPGTVIVQSIPLDTCGEVHTKFSNKYPTSLGENVTSEQFQAIIDKLNSKMSKHFTKRCNAKVNPFIVLFIGVLLVIVKFIVGLNQVLEIIGWIFMALGIIIAILIRNKFPNSVYENFLAEILKENPDTHYEWTITLKKENPKGGNKLLGIYEILLVPVKAPPYEKGTYVDMENPPSFTSNA